VYRNWSLGYSFQKARILDAYYILLSLYPQGEVPSQGYLLVLIWLGGGIDVGIVRFSFYPFQHSSFWPCVAWGTASF